MTTYRSADGNTIAGPGGIIIKNPVPVHWDDDTHEWQPDRTCAFCDQPATACRLCREHIRQDQEIQRRNDASKPRPTWAQKLDAGPEARNDW